MSETNLVYW